MPVVDAIGDAIGDADDNMCSALGRVYLCALIKKCKIYSYYNSRDYYDYVGLQLFVFISRGVHAVSDASHFIVSFYIIHRKQRVKTRPIKTRSY